MVALLNAQLNVNSITMIGENTLEMHIKELGRSSICFMTLSYHLQDVSAST